MKFTLDQWLLIRRLVENRLGALDDAIQYCNEKRKSDWDKDAFEKSLDKEKANCVNILDKLASLEI